MPTHVEQVLLQAKLNSGKTAFQLFTLAYYSLGEGITDTSIQNKFRFWELCDELPATVYNFCMDIVKGNRDIQQPTGYEN